MKSIILVTTGGTLDKVYSEQTGTVVNKESKIEQYLEQLRLPALEIKIVSVLNKDSLDMTDSDRQSLLEKIEELMPLKVPIVITHGTDTVVKSGLYLKQFLRSIDVPIILTGAMTPLGFEGSDGLQNLTESIFAAGLVQPSIYLVMHNQIFLIDRVRKDRELARFVSTECDEETDGHCIYLSSP
jgi:L-asparaginase